MKNMFSQKDKPLEEIRHVAIMIAEPVLNQRHTGIVYRADEFSGPMWLHLAYHEDLRHDQVVPAKYFWIDPSIKSRRLRQVAGVCVDIAEANSPTSIPYSFGIPQRAFDSRSKKFLVGPSKSGLTCASFVLAVFDCAGLPLVYYSGWPPPDDEDKRWQQSVLADLRRRNANPEHIAAVEREVGNSVRYRPEQVAGAAAIRAAGPIRYRYAKAIGVDVVRCLRGEGIAHQPKFSLWDRFLRFFGFG